MTKRYRETLDQVAVAAGGGGVDVPASFTWRGQTYQVVQVLGHWREEMGWWRRPDGQPIRIEQTDLWRVEARNPGLAHPLNSGLAHPLNSGLAHPLNGTPARGVYELVDRAGQWTLDRVWD